MNTTFIDTCVLDNYFDIPEYNQRVNEIQSEYEFRKSKGETFVIPFAAIVEIGNHIAHIRDYETRKARVQRFCSFLEEALNSKNPIIEQAENIDKNTLRFICENQHRLVAPDPIGSGDLSIFYQYWRFKKKYGNQCQVDLWSLDHHIHQLKAEFEVNAQRSTYLDAKTSRRRNR